MARPSTKASVAKERERPLADADAGAEGAFRELPTEARHPQTGELDTWPPEEVVKLMLDEEIGAVRAARARAPQIAKAARLAADRLADGGRLVYVGAGTSGRLGH